MLVSGLTNAEPRWPQYGFNARHSLFDPFEQTPNRSNVAAFVVAGCGQTVCSPLWTSAPSGLSLFTPTIANGVVYVGALDLIYTQGDVLAYPTTCNHGCQPLATLVLGGANETPIAVAGGRVYATTVNANIDSFGLPQ